MNILKNWKIYLFGIITISLVVAILAAVHFYNLSQQPAKVIAAQNVLKKPTAPVIDSFTDVDQNKHSEIQANSNQVPQAALKDSSVKRDSVINAVDRDLNLADASHLLEVTEENIQLRAAVLRLKTDSANKALLSYADNSISFKYDPRDSTLRDMLINLHLNQVKYSKQKLFTSTPVYDFWANDKRVTFSGFSHFSVAIPQPLFGLSADAKTSYDFSTGHIRPSIGLDLRIKNFHLEGRNYYSFKRDAFGQIVSVGYKQPIF